MSTMTSPPPPTALPTRQSPASRPDRRGWSVGDWVVYHKSKQSRVPGRRAALITPTGKGETYNYVVDKFWVVESVDVDGTLRLRTPGGKLHEVDPDDPNLAPAGLVTRLLWRHRFRRIQIDPDQAS